MSRAGGGTGLRMLPGYAKQMGAPFLSGGILLQDAPS